MSTAELQLRTAAFGGFQKQDVLNYIEKINQGHREQLEQIQKELAEALKAKTELEERQSEHEQQEAALNSEVERLTQEAAEARRSADRASAELAQSKDRQAVLEAELAQTKWEASRLKPSAEAYESLKDRTAGIELEAHHRAQGIQAEAEERVKKTRADAEQWLYKVQTGYDRIRTDLDAAVSHASGELERVRQVLAGITEEFADQNSALGGIIEAFQDSSPKAPEPLPLDEDA